MNEHHVQESQLLLVDFRTMYSASDIHSHPELSVLASFRGESSIAAISASTEVDGSGCVSVVAGLANGALSRLRMSVPTVPGSSPESITLFEEDFQEDASLNIWTRPHSGLVAAVDIAQGRCLVIP